MARTSPRRFAIGVDYGTNSVRALVVDVADGSEVATHVYDYPSGEAGILLDPKDPHLARQNPADYIEGFFVSVRRAMEAAKKQGVKPGDVAGIGVDTTGSTPIPVDRDGRPLALQPKFRKQLAAHAWLWKDHTSHAEAAEITAQAARHKDRYLTKCGGTYSSEWYWSKILHCRRTAPEVFQAAHALVELADFIPAFITGNTEPGHAALAESAPPATRRCTTTAGAGCPASGSSSRSTPVWRRSASDTRSAPCPPTTRPAN